MNIHTDMQEKLRAALGNLLTHVEMIEAIQGFEFELKEFPFNINAAMKEAADALSRTLNHDLLNQSTESGLPALGEEDPIFAINDDGAEFLAAIGALEEGEDPMPIYLGWRMGYSAERDWFSASKNAFALSCNNARDLINAIHTLETNGVTDPERDEKESA